MNQTPSGYNLKLSKRLREIGARYVVVHPIPKFILQMVMSGKVKPKDARNALRQASHLFTPSIDYDRKPARPSHGRGAHRRRMKAASRAL